MTVSKDLSKLRERLVAAENVCELAKTWRYNDTKLFDAYHAWLALVKGDSNDRI